MKRTFEQHLDPNINPKRILALDGGGIRGALTLGYLKEIETILRKKENDDTLLLCDYFDLIGGTSTGSIIAAGLCIGLSVDEIREMYMKLGGEIFGKKRSWKQIFKKVRANYDHQPLEDNLKAVFGNIILGGKEIKTGLCVVAKRADTNSTWPIINHPDGKYFAQNKNIPLWQAVRASSAAPTYFEPQMIDVGLGQRAAFVDGGVSLANNPALTLLMVATLKGFPFKWKMEEDKLELVSVGTGYSLFNKAIKEIKDAWLLTWASNVPNMLMQDASWQNQTVLQWLSNSKTPIEIDGEIGTLDGDLISDKPLIRYLRYNCELTENYLNGLGLGKTFTAKEVDSIVEMSNAENREILYDIGVKSAKALIDKAHFD